MDDKKSFGHEVRQVIGQKFFNAKGPGSPSGVTCNTVDHLLCGGHHLNTPVQNRWIVRPFHTGMYVHSPSPPPPPPTYPDYIGLVI